MHLKKEMIDYTPVQGLIEDVIVVLMENMEPMSTALESSENGNNELYIDFQNIFFSTDLNL